MCAHLTAQFFVHHALKHRSKYGRRNTTLIEIATLQKKFSHIGIEVRFGQIFCEKFAVNVTEMF
jgi:hypothetical protein